MRGQPESVGLVFNTPSLRNVGISAPYFHDGRFATLEDALAATADQGIDLHRFGEDQGTDAARALQLVGGTAEQIHRQGGEVDR